MNITTYCKNKTELDISLQTGIDNLIIGSNRFSYQNRFSFDESELAKLFSEIDNLTLSLEFFPSNSDFNEIIYLLDDLLLHRNKLNVRVCDTGLAYYLMKNYPQINIEFDFFRGYNNIASIELFAGKFSKHLKKIIFPREITLEELKKIPSIKDFQCELFVYGFFPVLISKRKLLSPVIQGNKSFQREKIKANQYEERKFFIEENQNGTIMTLDKKYSVIEQFDMFKPFIDSVVVDLTHINDYLEYKKAISFFQNFFNKKEFVREYFDFIQSDTNSGFFLENDTDQNLRKRKELEDMILVAEVVATTKPDVVAIETYEDFSLDDKLIAYNPKEEKIIYQLHKISNL